MNSTLWFKLPVFLNFPIKKCEDLLYCGIVALTEIVILRKDSTFVSAIFINIKYHKAGQINQIKPNCDYYLSGNYKAYSMFTKHRLGLYIHSFSFIFYYSEVKCCLVQKQINLGDLAINMLKQWKSIHALNCMHIYIFPKFQTLKPPNLKAMTNRSCSFSDSTYTHEIKIIIIFLHGCCELLFLFCFIWNIKNHWLPFLFHLDMK